MPRQADQVPHWRHLVCLRPAGDTTKLLTMVGVGYVLNGRVAARSEEFSKITQSFWIFTDRWSNTTTSAGDLDPGTGFLAAAMYGQVPYNCLGANDNAGENVVFSRGNTWGENENSSQFQWQFDIYEDGMAITKVGTPLALTAGPSASDTVSSSDCTLQVFDNRLNQLWIPEPAPGFAGPAQIAPVIDPALSLGISGQTKVDQQSLAILSDDETAATQTWIGMYAGQILDYLPDVRAYSIPVYPRSQSLGHWDWESMRLLGPGVDEEQGRIIQVQGEGYGYASIFMFGPLRSMSAVPVRTPRGSLIGGQFQLPLLGPPTYGIGTMSAVDSDGQLAQRPQHVGMSTSTQPENAAQFWAMIPRNLYDPTLPTPYDLEIFVTDNNTSTTRAFSSVDDVDPTHSLTIKPRFTCDWPEFTCSLRLRFRDREDAEWGDWEEILAPQSGNWTATETDPYWTSPYAAAQWIPNAWRTTAGGRDTITRGIEIPSGLFDGHSNAEACEMSLSIRCFSLSDHQDMNVPYSPFQGPAATATSIVAPRVDMTIASVTTVPGGLSLSYSTSGAPPFGTRLHISSIRIAGDEWIIPEGFDSEISDDSGTVLIPWTCGTWLSADIFDVGTPPAVEIAGTMETPYAVHDVVFSGTMPPMLVPQPGGVTEVDTTPLWSIFRSSSSLKPITSAFTTIMTERGSRIVECLPIASDVPGYSARIVQQTQSDRGSTPTSQIAVFVTGVNSADIQTISCPSRGVTTISWPVSNPDGTSDFRMVPIAGNIAYKFSDSRDVATARRLAGTAFKAGLNGGAAPSATLTGSAFDSSGDMLPSGTTTHVDVDDSLYAIFEIPADTTCLLRTSAGISHWVKITGIDAPRSIPETVDLTIHMVIVGGPHD